MGAVRVLVIAPHPLLREGIRLSLTNAGLEVVGEAADQFTGAVPHAIWIRILSC